MAGQRFNSGQVNQWGRTINSPTAAGFVPSVANRWISPNGYPINLGAHTSSPANRLNFWVYNVNRPMTVNRIGTYCWTLESGSLIRFGLYNIDENGAPTTLMTDYGTVSGASTGGKTVSGSTVVDGRFALGIATSNHSTVRWSFLNIAGLASAQVYPLYGDSAIANGRHSAFRYVNGTDYSGGMPNPAPSTSIGDNSDGNPNVYALIEFT